LRIVRSEKKPRAVVICGNGPTDRGLVACIARKINGDMDNIKTMWIYDTEFVPGLLPSALGYRAFELAYFLCEHKQFRDTEYIVIIIDREHLKDAIDKLKHQKIRETLISIQRNNKHFEEANIHRKTLLIGVCGEASKIEENLARLAEHVLKLDPNTLPRDKKLRAILSKRYNVDYYDIIKKASIDVLIKHLQCIIVPLKRIDCR